MKMLKTSLIFFIVALAGLSVSAQNSNPEEIKRIIESQQYVFKAQVAYPLSGQSRQLTSDYDLSISQNTVTCYLPYFGRAYIAPTDITEGGLKFTSTNFEYKATKKNKGWEIVIRPRDARDVQQFTLTVYDNGNAHLDVNNIRRQSISYSGYIK